MRSLRWLLLLAIVLVSAAVFRIYQVQQTVRKSQQRPVPSAVSLDTKTMANDWEWGQSGNGQPQVKMFAKSFRQSADGSRAELGDIELRIFQKDGLHFDRVKSKAAEFSTSDNRLYSPGAAEITLDVPVSGEPPHQLTTITTAGINFDSKSGQAVTDEHVAFTFENGDGTCTGARYDPQTHALYLEHDVTLNLRGKEPGSASMKVEAGELEWNETAGILVLQPWSRLTREQNIINAQKSTVKIDGSLIQWIDAAAGHGTDKTPGRDVDYSADALHVAYDDAGAIQSVNGTGHAKLIANSTTSLTTINGDQVWMTFATAEKETVLTAATATGHGSLESKPVPDLKGNTADTRLMKSEHIEVYMKPGGRELNKVETMTPGTMEFVPNQAGHHRRLLKADRITVGYGARNEIQTFHATAASTETYPSEEDLRRKRGSLATAHTSSRTLDVAFDEKGEVRTMKQSGDFRYAEAERKAQAESATLENEKNVMTLERGARIADDTGSTTADQIVLDQATGDFDARGHAVTVRLADQKNESSAMLDKSAPTQGSADRVTSANRNHVLHYAGNAAVWQASNRIQAERIDIDRDRKTLLADGKVVTQFQDEMRPTATVVKAQHMVYTDADRQAHYTGGVDFWRPSMTVKSEALQAWLNEENSGADSRLNHAFSDGKVEIVQFAADRQRVGNSEHAEYYTGEGKIVLSGGAPQLQDSKRGSTKGDKLTYFTNDDRLLVDGAPDQKKDAKEPKTQSHLRKKS